MSDSKHSIMSLTATVASLRETVLEAGKPGADIKAVNERLAKLLEGYTPEEAVEFANIITGKQTHLPGMPDTVIMIEDKKPGQPSQ
jgi:hypothetical protein